MKLKKKDEKKNFFLEYKQDLLHLIKEEKNIILPDLSFELFSEIRYLETFCQMNGIGRQQGDIWQKHKEEIREIMKNNKGN